MAPKASTEGGIEEVQAPADFWHSRLAAEHELVSRLFADGGAGRFGLSNEHFTATLADSCGKYLSAEADAATVREFLSKLRVEELILARACAAGNEAAWETFLLRYRKSLYQAGISIAGDYQLGRDLADSLYADLWGAGNKRGTSVLNSYMGYGSLEGWLRTIMARSFIDRYRSERRLVSLEDQIEDGLQLIATPEQPAAKTNPYMEEAVDEALGNLNAEDRYILASFFLHDRTLAELAAVLKVHESTASRRVQKITANIRKQIVRGLMRRGLSRRQADELLETDVRDLQINVRGRLQENLQETPDGPSFQQGTNNREGQE
jgi:RNA polymerase sigma-70 factor, ECF subfamily